jgi:hypothetical protein
LKHKKGDKWGIKKEKSKHKKVIKEEEPKIKVLTHELVANSLVILQSFKSLFMDSSHVKVV